MENLENKDYLESIKIEDLVTYYTQLLHSRMELVQYNYPNEFYDEQGVIIEHLGRCHIIFSDKIYSLLREVKDEDGERLSDEEVKIYGDLKILEIMPLIDQISEKYIEDVKVIDVNLDVELIEIELNNNDDDHDDD